MKAIVSTTNDLITDQRVHKTCLFLVDKGYEVIWVGRKKKDSLEMPDRPYTSKRFKLLFEKGPFFYAEYNLRLFFYLLVNSFDLLVSNDLDTLLPNYLANVLKQKNLVYDSHEFYTETPELANRRSIQRIWETIERMIFPHLKTVITVNESIARLYTEKYGNKLHIVRNIPPLRDYKITSDKEALRLDPTKKIIILQGAGINVQRGSEELVEAMKYVHNATLLIIGGGDVLPQLKAYVQNEKLNDRIRFIPKQPLEKLYQYTVHADLGVSIDKDTNLNYRYSLPNKLFDYIHARVPVLASNLTEIAKIINKYHVGIIIEKHDPNHIAEWINSLFEDTDRLDSLKENTKFASKELNWQKEIKALEEAYKPYV